MSRTELEEVRDAWEVNQLSESGSMEDSRRSLHSFIDGVNNWWGGHSNPLHDRDKIVGPASCAEALDSSFQESSRVRMGFPMSRHVSG